MLEPAVISEGLRYVEQLGSLKLQLPHDAPSDAKATGTARAMEETSVNAARFKSLSFVMMFTPSFLHLGGYCDKAAEFKISALF